MSAVAEPPFAAEERAVPLATARRLDRLALLYEGILTVIGRVHTGRQRMQDPEGFRSRMKQALREISSTAARKGYTAEDVEECNFAVVAFLDEAILTAPDAASGDWAGKSLGEELFAQRSAGELFFKRLEMLRAHRDSQHLAEVLEVYYLCLLLGYEGKFAGGSQGELLLLMSNLRERIERIVGRDPQFSPDASVPLYVAHEPVPIASARSFTYAHIRLFAAVALLSAIFCYVAASLQLDSQLAAIEQAVRERTASGDPH